jgi:DNA-binding transcriptional LysR family regulator
MKFSLGDLEAFVAVAERGSFRGAASAVHLSQPALSRRIEKLESALGVRLLDRTLRPISPTAVGREFYRKTRTLLDELGSTLLVIGETAASQSGEVVVACVPSAAYYYLPGFVRVFHARFPRVLVQINDEAAGVVLDAVIRGEADFGITFVGARESGVEFQPLLRERFVAACRKDHPLAAKHRVTWADLSQYDYVSVTKSSGNRLLIDQALAKLSVRPRASFEVRHVASTLGLVEAGLGVAAVPQLAMPKNADALLVSRPLVQPVVMRTLGVIRRRGRVLTPAAQALYDLLLANRLPKAAARRSKPPLS